MSLLRRGVKVANIASPCAHVVSRRRALDLLPLIHHTCCVQLEAVGWQSFALFSPKAYAWRTSSQIDIHALSRSAAPIALGTFTGRGKAFRARDIAGL